MSCTRVLQFAIDSMLNVIDRAGMSPQNLHKTPVQSIKEIKGIKPETLRCRLAIFVFGFAYFDLKVGTSQQKSVTRPLHTITSN